MFPFRKNKYRNLSDEELILHYKDDGVSLVIGLLYERYAHLVIGSCMKYLKNEQEAEDITMQIFEDLHRKLLKYEITYFKSWLYQLTRNECLMHLRKSKKEVSHDVLEGLSESDETVELAIQEMKYILMEGSLQELKEEQRICLELFYLQDKSYQEISAVLNIDIKQVKSAIQNGKRNLKMKLEDHHEFRSE